MSFLDNPKNAGTVLWLIGIIQIVLGVVNIVLGALGVEVDGEEIDLVEGVVNGIGTIIIGFLYFGFGKAVRSGEISTKWDILVRFIYLFGMQLIISGIFTYSADAVDWAVQIVVGIILGLIVFWIVKRMTDGKTDTLDKIIWILLLLIFIISAIVDILAMLAFPVGTIMGIAGFIVDAFMIICLLDNEVKAKMGM